MNKKANSAEPEACQACLPPTDVADGGMTQPTELSDDDCHGDFGEGGDGESNYEELSG